MRPWSWKTRSLPRRNRWLVASTCIGSTAWSATVWGGRGDGPVGLLLETSPVDMHDAYTQDQADGQLFFTITRGRVTMPYYRDALSAEERWHVINYIRATFGSE